jgi:hypothetical protein
MTSQQHNNSVLLTSGQRWAVVAAGDDNLPPSNLGNGVCSSSDDPMMGRAPTGTVVLGKSPWTVGSAWVATQQHGCELRQRLGFGQPFSKSKIASALFIGKFSQICRGRGV